MLDGLQGFDQSRMCVLMACVACLSFVPHKEGNGLLTRFEVRNISDSVVHILDRLGFHLVMPSVSNFDLPLSEVV